MRLIPLLFVLLPLLMPPVQAAPLMIMDFGGTAAPVPLPVGEPGKVDKARIDRLDDGTLVIVYTDGNGPEGGAWTPQGQFFQPRDIFVVWSRDNGATWSSPLNISHTANQTDVAAQYDPDGSGPMAARPFYGNVGKPTLFTVGTTLVITWSSNWCGTGVHGPAVYSDFNGVEIPYACVYAARLASDSSGITLLGVDRLTDAARDALDPVVRGTAAGWALVWQEDPQGLQLGHEDGPGEGDSGAKVSPGTDIWYSYLLPGAFDSKADPWSAPVPVSDNFDYSNGVAGTTGASRANLVLTGSQAIVAYEQSKGKGSTGKYVIYQNFPFKSPVAGAPGTVISDPAENGRRVRLVAQSNPGSTGLRLFIFWREGLQGQGGPADVVGRLGRVPAGISTGTVPAAGFRPEDLFPAVDPATPANNLPALNLTSANLSDGTGTNSEEDARAHRALLRGDAILFAYTYTASQSLAASAQANYDFYLRRSTDGGVTWSAPDNLSQLPLSETVIEPRLVGTPPTLSGSTNPGDKRNVNAVLAAWTVAANEDASLGLPTVSMNLVATRSMDQGLTFEVPTTLATGLRDGSVQNAEIQVRSNPAGTRADMVWIHTGGGETRAWYANAGETLADADLAVAGVGGPVQTHNGARFSLRYAIANHGRYPATAVVIGGTVPQALAGWIQSATLSGVKGTCNVRLTTFDCRIGQIPEGAQAGLQLDGISLGSDRQATVTVSAVTSEQRDPITDNNSATMTLVSVADSPTDTSGGCSLNPASPFDPTLPALLGIAVLTLAIRQRRQC